jgi:hypothetical protein
MPLRDLYYLLKPAIPARIRAAARRMVARRLRRRVGHCWPIDEASGLTPKDWPGWPGGKRFAFVLTHDVEGARGVDRCRQLAEMEISLGFRSSFNFVPEGEYATPPSLRAFLNEAGFEVGVHDRHHDGKLYRSRKAFERHAERINHYLKAWDAVGFRSAFMLHNLDWLGRLHVLYDASTFDTDPFEPQPDGVKTIFPFWVRRSSAAHGSGPDGVSGYVELPYTLPQDSTLFLVLGESTIEIWKNKLDWISSRGGMALVNVHPDYMSFDRPARGSKRAQFGAALYEQFLTYARSRYGREAWFALPHEVAAYVHGYYGGVQSEAAVWAQ